MFTKATRDFLRGKTTAAQATTLGARTGAEFTSVTTTVTACEWLSGGVPLSVTRTVMRYWRALLGW